MSDHPSRASLAAAVAELNDLVVNADLDGERTSDLAAEVRRLVESFGTADHTVDTSLRWREYRRRSPFSGVENPRAPGLVMALDPDVDERTAANGEITVGSAWAGPPGAVHGGVVAGLFDEAIGWIASAASPDQPVVTAKLTVRYRHPTPIDTPLRFRAEVERRSSRRLNVVATCRCNGRETASAEALMVGI